MESTKLIASTKKQLLLFYLTLLMPALLHRIASYNKRFSVI